MAQTILESLFANELETIAQNDTAAEVFLNDMNVTFGEIYSLVDARDAVSNFLGLKEAGTLDAAALKMEEQKLFETVPEAVFAAVGGKEGKEIAEEGFWSKIKEKISNFFNVTVAKFIKSLKGLDFADQAKKLEAELKSKGDIIDKTITIKSLPCLTANNGKNIWSPKQMAGHLDVWSSLDKHFDNIWAIASKPGKGPFENHIGPIARTMFHFAGANQQNKMAVGWNKDADEMLLSEQPITADNVSWMLHDWSKGKGGGKYDTDTKEEILLILSKVGGYEKALEKMERSAEDKWAKSLSNKEFSKEDFRRCHNVMMFFYGVLQYMRSYVRQALAYVKLHVAVAAAK